MVPPGLDLETRGWILHEKRDRDGNQKLLWPFKDAEVLAEIWDKTWPLL